MKFYTTIISVDEHIRELLNMDNDALIKSLQALDDASFPKSCDGCGKVFKCERDYLQNTIPCQHNPNLTEITDRKGRRFLKLARNCTCGKPIVDYFDDRRDKSKKGEIKRSAFNKVINTLLQEGLKREQARTELINYMSNKKSPLLEKLGVFKR